MPGRLLPMVPPIGSVTQLCPTLRPPWTAAGQAGGGFWQNMVPWGREWPLQCSCLENPMNSMKRVPLIFCSKSSGKGRRVAEHLGSWRGYCPGQPHIGIFIIWVPLDDSDVLSGLRNTAPLGSDTQPTQALVIQSLSAVQLFVTLWTAARQASLSFTISWSSLRLMSIDSVMLSNPLIICHPLLLLPSIFPSIRVFSNESTLHQVAKVLELQVQHQSCQWMFRVDFL